MIFHEINKTGLVLESIQQLISDELLSKKICAENWLEVFANEIRQSDSTFFIANSFDFQIVKESTRVHILNIST